MRRASPLLAALFILAAGCTFGQPPREMPYYEQVLSGEPFTDLVVEVDHAPGHRPSAAATTHLVSTLKNVTSKARVTLVLDESLPAEARDLTFDELLQMERDTRSTEHRAPVAVLHVLYPAGTYNGSNAAGVTISGPVLGPVSVYLDVIRSIPNPVEGGPLGPLPGIPNPERAVEVMERATLLHEAGHAMGLVDNGLPMVTPREDPEHPGHPTNAQSVMYWAIESTAGLRQLLVQDGSVPDEFDADDRADLRSVGGR